MSRARSSPHRRHGTTHRKRGSDARPAPALHELPVSYFGNVDAIQGPEDEIAWPSHTDHVDYELELGIVIGRPGRDLTPDTSLDHVLGLTVFNDFSAGDIQLREIPGGLGPSKGNNSGRPSARASSLSTDSATTCG